MLSLIILLALAVAIVALPVNNDYLIQCAVGNEKDLQFLLSRQQEDFVDLWDHSITQLPKTVTMRIQSKSLQSVTVGLKCEKALNMAQFEEKMFAILKSNKGGLARGYFADFHPYVEIEEQIRDSSVNNKNVIVRNEVLGKSIEGRNISLIHIKSAKGNSEKKIWISCGQHAREWIAPAACLYAADQFSKMAESDARIQNFLKTYQVYIVPLMNPDGYEYSRNRDRYWRKNRRANLDGSFGVDLNRNWPNRFGLTGTSNNPRSDIYRGPKGSSEPEVKLLVKYILGLKNVVAGVDVHSYGEHILRNFGWTTSPCPEEAHFSALGNHMMTNINNIHGSAYDSTKSGELYPTGGSMDDWFYEKAGFPGFTLELRDKGKFGFLLPPSEIVPSGQELVEGIVSLGEKLLGEK